MPIDDVIQQLEQAVLAAATNATDGAKGDSPGTASTWAQIAHTLADSLAKVKDAYKPR